MRILALDDKEKIIEEAVAVLRAGGLVVFPTDTVYGLLVDAENETAVKKLIAFKERPVGKAISVFVSDLKMMEEYVIMSHKQELILKQLLPGPFTVVLPSKHKTSLLLESEKRTLGIRIPQSEIIYQLLTAYQKPITATSANLAGKSPHYSVELLLKTLSFAKKSLIDLIIDGGKLPQNKPSTVIDLTQPQVTILRAGDIQWQDEKNYVSDSAEQTQKIAAFLGKKILKSSTKPYVFILQGDLGTGKTVFVKGLASLFGITNIISPTFTIYYEYPIETSQNFRNLYHFDLYNIEDEEEYKHLGINSYLQQGNILCFEWGEKAGKLIEDFKAKANIIYIHLKYINKSQRRIEIKVNNNNIERRT